jgi:hypothetical protein
MLKRFEVSETSNGAGPFGNYPGPLPYLVLGELLLWLVYQLTNHVAVSNKLLGPILTRQLI